MTQFLYHTGFIIGFNLLTESIKNLFKLARKSYFLKQYIQFFFLFHFDNPFNTTAILCSCKRFTTPHCAMMLKNSTILKLTYKILLLSCKTANRMRMKSSKQMFIYTFNITIHCSVPIINQTNIFIVTFTESAFISFCMDKKKVSSQNLYIKIENRAIKSHERMRIHFCELFIQNCNYNT